jgi:hypothetical protein
VRNDERTSGTSIIIWALVSPYSVAHAANILIFNIYRTHLILKGKVKRRYFVFHELIYFKNIL